jgi:hypothetical protein
MSSISQFFGGGSSSSGLPIGAIVQGTLSGNSNYLPCDGSEYLKSAYPNFNTTGLYALDAATLTTKTVPSGVWQAGCYANGIYVLGSNSAGATVATTDFTNFTSGVATGVGAIYNIQYVNNMFFALGSSGIATSTDGVTWTARTAPGFTAGTGSIVYFNGLYVAGNAYVYNPSSSSTDVKTSPDLTTWTSRACNYGGYIAGHGKLSVIDNSVIVPMFYDVTNSSGNYVFLVFQSNATGTTYAPGGANTGTYHGYGVQAGYPLEVVKVGRSIVSSYYYNGSTLLVLEKTGSTGLTDDTSRIKYITAGSYKNGALWGYTIYGGTEKIGYSLDGRNFKLSKGHAWTGGTYSTPNGAFVVGPLGVLYFSPTSPASTSLNAIVFDATKFATPVSDIPHSYVKVA